MNASIHPHPARARYEDQLESAEDLIAEILEGKLVRSTRPTLPQCRTAAMIAAELVPHFDWGRASVNEPGDWWILERSELHLSDDVIVPDLAGWRRSRLPKLSPGPYLSLAPDWACEILSPATEALDRVAKMRIYAREHVPYLWLVNPSACILEVYQLEAACWILVCSFSGNARVRAVPFQGIELDLSRWWLTPARNSLQ